ncbi:ankyrin, partial [Diplogelasinospora grovesii]
RQSDCRELVKSNRFIPRPTPSIELHRDTCTCKEIQAKRLQDEDEALANRILATSEARRARKGKLSRRSTSLSFTSNQSLLQRLFGSSTPAIRPSSAKAADLCFGCSTLDIDKVARYLLDEGIPINSRNDADTTPLMAVVRAMNPQARPKSHLAMISFLLDCGADPNATTKSVYTPCGPGGTMSVLAAACSLNLPAVVKLLLDRGAAVDAPLTSIPMFRFEGHGLTALHMATFADNTACLKLLLEHGGANVNATFNAAKAGSKPAGSRKKWDISGVTALHLADDSATCTEVLLQAGADPLAKDSRGRVPLHWAAEAGNADVVRLLLQPGFAVVDMQDDTENGATPLATLCARLETGARRQGDPEILGMLLAAGASHWLVTPGHPCVTIGERMLMLDNGRDVYRNILK